ncbi:hypothetical protein CLV24_12445 [Pontibacter ummariensis]|uniref:Uncharacterized protein n=1 Tax=Pontibacter ummariensis TaxID=1610492 RepID=A0A239JVQ0_9BACT|nr:hypothetical protein [Pontibacter ummariensis]PRY07307.1 hypothetical protein CLV24_12445 [Pontibacter ummariensis]SNT09987.1 hypothetical protein SAMN06296052_12419 [Pontibacter ummariensis]
MRITAKHSPQAVASSYNSAIVSALLPHLLQEEEPVGYATIDGHVVTHLDGASAVSNGAGIFIGDYFVGIADSYQSISNSSFVRY